MAHNLETLLTRKTMKFQKKDKKTIFEQFARVESGPILKEGMGLGLFISKHIVEAHGGIILVESTVKQGSTFTVELPRS
jgi:signal transduction histidine kinase